MPTISTTTALVAHDHTQGDDPDLANCICVLTIARGDGSLFDADSLQEEEVVELCVGMGQVHLNGVLWLSVTESVIAFDSSEEMLACLITMATVWHDDSLRLCTQPPTVAQIHHEGWTSLWHPCTYPIGVQFLHLCPVKGGPDPNSIYPFRTWMAPCSKRCCLRSALRQLEGR